MKKILMSVFVLIACFTLTSCSQIEDNNGKDNYRVETITDQDITSNSEKCLEVFSVSVDKDGILKVSAKKFSGVKTIDRNIYNNTNVEYTVNIKVDSGNFRLVLVLENTIINEFPINETSKFAINNANGKYLIRIAGESAKYEVTITTKKI